MDRNALLLYLQNVRDLEIAKYDLNKRYQSDYSAYVKRKSFLNSKPKQYTSPERPDKHLGSKTLTLIGSLSFLLLPVVGFIGLFTDPEEFAPLLSEPFMIFMFLICIIVGVALFFAFMRIITVEKKEIQQWKQDVVNTKATNIQNAADYENRKSSLPALERDWTNKVHWYQKELQKANDLLNSFYRMNILPNQYRNLPSVLYIYDYMSSSSATFEDTLIHEHMENGIQRLKAKLNSIIGQPEDILYETRCIRAENQGAIERTIQQNNQMLQSLQQTEQNTLASAQYAELSANYSKANAYFSLATYLKR